MPSKAVLAELMLERKGVRGWCKSEALAAAGRKADLPLLHHSAVTVLPDYKQRMCRRLSKLCSVNVVFRSWSSSRLVKVKSGGVRVATLW